MDEPFFMIEGIPMEHPMATYVQRMARNYLHNMAPRPEEAPSARAALGESLFSGEQIDDRLQNGLAALHDWMAGLYRGAMEAPESLLLPLHPDEEPRTGSRYAASYRAFEALPALMYGLGRLGKCEERDGQAMLRVPAADFAKFCKEARVKKLPALLEALREYGLETVYEGEEWLLAWFPGAPDIALALPSFAQACHTDQKGAGGIPHDFARLNLRVLQSPKARKKLPLVTLEDALRALDPEQAAYLSDMVALVEGLGFRGQVKCSGLIRGEWRASYANAKLGRTLFGFYIEEGVLGVRMMIDLTARLLPALERCPASLKAKFYAAHTCDHSHNCAEGPVKAFIDGEEHTLCHYALFDAGELRGEEAAAFRMLVEAQGKLLVER